MSNGTKILLIVLAIVIVLAVIVIRTVRKIKRKVKATLDTVDRCGEYAGRILRIADKVRDGETKELLRGMADDFKLSDIKDLITSDNKLDAVLDMLESEADGEQADAVKISEAAVALKGLLAERIEKH